jgi:hypothetical protein
LLNQAETGRIKIMALIGVFLITLKIALWLLLVVVPVLAICGFGGMLWCAGRLSSTPLAWMASHTAVMGIALALAWMAGNDAVGFLGTLGQWP